MTDPEGRMRERELERRRENELKDLQVEDTPGERPLEGLSHATGTTWTREQDDSRRKIHERDEAEAHARSIAQIPPPPPETGEE